MNKSKLLIAVLLIGICQSSTNSCFAQFTKLFDFTNTAKGRNPLGSLISDGNFLYGMTSRGGIRDMGIVFKIKHNSTGYAKLLDFEGMTNGSQPKGSLISDGTFLYGMTNLGGTNDLGVIFKIKPDGTGYSKLLDFTGALTGSQPEGSLTFDGTFLYGMTRLGGTTEKGVIFKIKPDGTNFSKILDLFDNKNGRQPRGALYFDGTYLYGMTNHVVSNISGYVFRIKTDGSGFGKLYNFDNDNKGWVYKGSIIYDGTFL